MAFADVVPDTISYNAFVQAVVRTQDEIGVTKFKSLRRYRFATAVLISLRVPVAAVEALHVVSGV